MAGMKAWHIIGITGDATRWCLPCARRAYGAEVIASVVQGTGAPVDYEGNELRPVFVSDLSSDDEICTHCGDSLSASSYSL